MGFPRSAAEPGVVQGGGEVHGESLQGEASGRPGDPGKFWEGLTRGHHAVPCLTSCQGTTGARRKNRVGRGARDVFKISVHRMYCCIEHERGRSAGCVCDPRARAGNHCMRSGSGCGDCSVGRSRGYYIQTRYLDDGECADHAIALRGERAGRS